MSEHIPNEPKMRVSTARDDIGFCPHVFSIKPTIYINGVEDRMVLMADERLGRAIVWNGSEDEAIHGEVRIEGFTQAQREAHADAMEHRIMIKNEQRWPDAWEKIRYEEHDSVLREVL